MNPPRSGDGADETRRWNNHVAQLHWAEMVSLVDVHSNGYHTVARIRPGWELLPGGAREASGATHPPRPRSEGEPAYLFHAQPSTASTTRGSLPFTWAEPVGACSAGPGEGGSTPCPSRDALDVSGAVA
jgi:hypothetical protein